MKFCCGVSECQTSAFGCIKEVFECINKHSDALEKRFGLLRQRVSECLRMIFGCLEANSNAQESIRILKGAAVRRVSECVEEAFGYAFRLSGYWKRVSECLQLEEHEQQ